MLRDYTLGFGTSGQMGRDDRRFSLELASLVSEKKHAVGINLQRQLLHCTQIG